VLKGTLSIFPFAVLSVNEIILPVAVVGIVCFAVLIFVLSGTKRCPKNKIMVIYGRNDDMRSKSFKPVCYSGGTHFVNPLTKKYTFMEKRLIHADITFDKVSCKDGETLTFYMTSSMLVSDKKGYMEKAAQLFAAVPKKNVDYAVEKAAERVILSAVAKWEAQQIHSNEQDFYLYLYDSLTVTMAAIGLEIYNGRFTGITFMSENARKYNDFPWSLGCSFHILRKIKKKS